jgi:hypothetical protein
MSTQGTPEEFFHLLGAGGTFSSKRQRAAPAAAPSKAVKKEKIDFFAPDVSEEVEAVHTWAERVTFTELPEMSDKKEIAEWRKAYR